MAGEQKAYTHDIKDLRAWHCSCNGLHKSAAHRGRRENRERDAEMKAIVTTYQRRGGKSTEVVSPGGSMRFVDLLTKRDALKNCEHQAALAIARWLQSA